MNLRNLRCQTLCDALPNFVPFVQAKKYEKHPRKSATFGKTRVDDFLAKLILQKIYREKDCIQIKFCIERKYI